MIKPGPAQRGLRRDEKTETLSVQARLGPVGPADDRTMGVGGKNRNRKGLLF
jgi:hypothetical protein